MPDVILPALNEARAIPAVIGGLPSGYDAIVVDNGSDDGTADVARAAGARVIVEARRGFGAACFAGLVAATADVVCFMDCDGSFDGADLARVARPVMSGEADLVLGARRAGAGAWPLHARAGNRLLAWELRRRTGLALRDLGPMRAARREQLLGLGLVDRRFGWPLEMVLRSWQAGWCIHEVEVRYQPRVGRSKVTGTVGGTAANSPGHDPAAPMKATIIVIAKSPVPGRVKTRLCPPCTPAEAALVAAAALADTLTVVAATPATARVLALEGSPGPWIPAGFVIVAQAGRGLDERLANAFAAVTGPAILVGMDTPQVSIGHLTAATEALLEPDVDAVLAPAVDGGWWAIGLRRADARVFQGVPMSTEHTFRDQTARLRELGYRTTTLDTLRDVDTFSDVLDVAATIPTSRFAAAVSDLCRAERAAG